MVCQWCAWYICVLATKVTTERREQGYRFSRSTLIDTTTLDSIPVSRETHNIQEQKLSTQHASYQEHKSTRVHTQHHIHRTALVQKGSQYTAHQDHQGRQHTQYKEGDTQCLGLGNWSKKFCKLYAGHGTRFGSRL